MIIFHLSEKDPEYFWVLLFCYILLYGVLQDEFDIPMTKKFVEEVTEMCNLSKGVMEKGLEKGMEKGILRSVRAAMENLKVPAEQAMEILQVPADEREAIRKALES